MLVIKTSHPHIKSVHGDLITQQDPVYEKLQYNLSVLFWDIETTSTEENSTEIQKTAVPYMISAIYRD